MKQSDAGKSSGCLALAISWLWAFCLFLLTGELMHAAAKAHAELAPNCESARLFILPWFAFILIIDAAIAIFAKRKILWSVAATFLLTMVFLEFWLHTGG